MKLDIKDFYPSISRDRVFYQFLKIGYGINIANLLANICIWNNSLPQGAPTSAYLANLICIQMDQRIAGYCNKRNITFTRYADDLIFSSDDWSTLHNLYGMVKEIIKNEGFRLNEEKTVFAGTQSRKEVLGITINEQKLKSPKEMKRMVRAMIHRAIATGDYSEKSRIDGYISYISSIEKDYVTKIKEYICRLSQSELCLYKDVVDAYNSNKFFPDLPDMVLKHPRDFHYNLVQYQDCEEEHNCFCYRIDYERN